MNILKILAASGMLACIGASMPAIAAPNSTAPIDTSVLSERRIVVRSINKPVTPGASYFAATVIDAPVEKLCAIIHEYADYPTFMPNTRQTRVVHAAEDYALVEMALTLPIGKTRKYRVKMEPRSSERSCKLHWKLVPSEDIKPEETIADTSGYWQLRPYPANRNKTVVEYYVHANPGPVPLGFGGIVDVLTERSGEKMTAE